MYFKFYGFYKVLILYIVEIINFKNKINRQCKTGTLNLEVMFTELFYVFLII